MPDEPRAASIGSALAHFARHWLPLAGALAAMAFLPLARASDNASPSHERSATAPAKPVSAAPSPKAEAVKPAAEAPAVDPIDHLQRRLAEKLGGRKSDSSPSAFDIRVAAKPAEPTAAVPARRGRVDVAALAAAAQAHGAHPGETQGAHGDVHWSYGGDAGPEAWARLKPEFAQCGSGQRQSPIDIRDGLKVELDPIAFSYRPSAFGVLDNGHTVQVNVAPGNTIDVRGQHFELVQFHFHRPSEERIEGRVFDMVAHLVHKDPSGRLAVVAVLLDKGSAQSVVQQVWNNLPLEKGQEQRARAQIDLNQLLPADRRYYTYMGSLTTPPCSEGVLWMVMKQPVPISDAQISLFSRLYPMNARPIQNAAGRMIQESN